MDYVYSVYDSCSALFGDPFIATNDAVAKRLFEHSVSNPSLPKYIREDSVLYCLGAFDRKAGSFTAVTPYVVSRGSSVLLTADWNTPDDLEVKHNEK